MWSPLLEPGRLLLATGDAGDLRGFQQELAHYTVHAQEGCVLWCDSVHGFNPYEFAEINLERGFPAEWGADRVLIKRCMTPFQWDTVLTRHLDQKLLEVEVGLVLVAHYGSLFSTDELKDWEQEDYVRFSLRHLKDLARRHQAPILLTVDMRRWWTTHPTLAQATFEAADARWSVRRVPGGWSARPDGGGRAIEQFARRSTSLRDFLEEPAPIPAVSAAPARAR